MRKDLKFMNRYLNFVFLFILFTIAPVSHIAAQTQTGKANGYEWVDLGLSVKWATTNLGASSTKGYGDFYEWGAAPNQELPSDSFLRANNDIIAHTDYDIVTSELGQGWYTPTEAQVRELYANTTQKWCKQDGLNGLLLTSKINGNSIFLPAGGNQYQDGKKLKKESVGKEGTYLTSSSKTIENKYHRHLRFKINKEDNFDFTAYCGGYGFIRPVYSEKISDWVYAKRKLDDAVNKKDTDADSYDNMNIGEKLFINYASALRLSEIKEQRFPTDDGINLLSCLKRRNFDIIDVLKNEKLSLNDSIVVLTLLQKADISLSIPGFVYMGQSRPDCDVYWAESNYKLNGQTGFSKSQIPSPYTVIAKNDFMPIELTATIPTFEDFEWLVNNSNLKIDDEIKRKKYNQTEYDKLRNAEEASYLNNPLLAPYIHTTYSEFKGAEIISKKNNNKIYMPKGEYWTSTQKDVLYFSSGYNEVGFSSINISDSYNGTPFARYVVYASPSERNKWEKLKFQWKKELGRLLQRKATLDENILSNNEPIETSVSFKTTSDVENYLLNYVFVNGKNQLKFVQKRDSSGGVEWVIVINDKRYLLSSYTQEDEWGHIYTEYRNPKIELFDEIRPIVAIYNEKLGHQSFRVDALNNTIFFKGKNYAAKEKPINSPNRVEKTTLSESYRGGKIKDSYGRILSPITISYKRQGNKILEAYISYKAGFSFVCKGEILENKLLFRDDYLEVLIEQPSYKGEIRKIKKGEQPTPVSFTIKESVVEEE